MSAAFESGVSVDLWEELIQNAATSEVRADAVYDEARNNFLDACALFVVHRDETSLSRVHEHYAELTVTLADVVMSIINSDSLMPEVNRRDVIALSVAECHDRQLLFRSLTGCGYYVAIDETEGGVRQFEAEILESAADMDDATFAQSTVDGMTDEIKDSLDHFIKHFPVQSSGSNRAG